MSTTAMAPAAAAATTRDETIRWHLLPTDDDDGGDRPDDMATVLASVQLADGSVEVWPAWHEDGCWIDAASAGVVAGLVTAWADMPVGVGAAA